VKIKRVASVFLTTMFLLIVLIKDTKANGLIGLVAPQTKSAVESIARESRKIFVGSIGGKYDIRMYLWREGETFSGYYLYETSGGNINLVGTINANGSFVLKESDVEGNQTGIFKGKLTRSNAGPETALRLEGTWSKPDGTSAMSFALTEQTFDLGGGMKIVSKGTSSKSKKPAYTIEARYPQIQGSTEAGVAAFNKAINSLVASQIANFKKVVAETDVVPGAATESGLTIDYEITFATDALVSVAFGVSPYLAGAAHPQHYTSVLTFDLKAGNAIALAEVFKPGANYLQTLSTYCIAQLKKRIGDMSDIDWINRGASAKRDNYQNWNIGRKGLEITFDPYQVAAHAAGPQRVIVRYDALKSLLNPNSPVTVLAK
jgi:hypothetical protein